MPSTGNTFKSMQWLTFAVNINIKVVFSLCSKCILVDKRFYLYVFSASHLFFWSVPLALRVISCEVSEVCLTARPSLLWIQTQVAFGNAPSVITSCDAQQVPQQRDERRQRWGYQSQWLQFQTKRTAWEQKQEQRACQGRKELWRSVSASHESPSTTDLSPCP